MTQEQEESLLDISAVLEEPPPLVIEIVSPDNPTRDYPYKRNEYAAREIPEYWIVDPQKSQVMILKLIDGAYEEEILTGGDRLQSNILGALDLTAEHILAGHP